MQTILGSGGAIGIPLAKELKNYTSDIRLVARHPEKVNDTDQLFVCDLLDAESVNQALRDTEIAYLTVGLKYDFKTWKRDWPTVMRNVINGCIANNCKLVFFDNVYMYGTESIPHMTEESLINPSSKKGKVRAELVRMIFNAMENEGLKALIARSADFYGPDAKASAFMIGIVHPLQQNKKPFWQADASKIHSFTYTPDAAKAVALLGNTPSAYGEVWHLPSSLEKLTGKDFVEITASLLDKPFKYKVYGKGLFRFLGFFNTQMKELAEMLYQYDRDYFFDSSKFEKTFSIRPVDYKTGIEEMLRS